MDQNGSLLRIGIKRRGLGKKSRQRMTLDKEVRKRKLLFQRREERKKKKENKRKSKEKRKERRVTKN